MRVLLFALLLVVGDMAQAWAAGLPTLWVVGDSTAHIGGDAEVSTDGREGWGSPFDGYWNPAKIRVVNAAMAGRSSRTFRREGLWADVLRQVHPGDFVLIQFGHNDPGALDDAKGRGSLPGLGEETREVAVAGRPETVHTFGWYLRQYIAETRAKRAMPIVLSVTPRDIWTDGRVELGLGHYREWAQQIAATEQVPFVDVTGLVGARIRRWGRGRSRRCFPSTTPTPALLERSLRQGSRWRG